MCLSTEELKTDSYFPTFPSRSLPFNGRDTFTFTWGMGEGEERGVQPPPLAATQTLADRAEALLTCVSS
ncbi:hypothetical protein E2C01_099292 [Portunus trituberculatus]|uniref:Uncharacterized protein n=1 Tax=Portunus trituberculatus TaxID=210409 RepID=A0A5B7K991_PORTR|nr:hypothetical protein [Portunus trituberculatus]